MTDRPRTSDDRLLAYFEGALTGEERAEIEARIGEDAAARETLAGWQQQNDMIAALYDPVAEEPVPERLSAVLSQADNRRPLPLVQIAAALALLAIGGAAGWFAASIGQQPGADPSRAAISAHVTYVSEVRHPVEVTAAEADHLTGWLSKRLGQPIKAPDFAARGFRLMGGRLLPGGDGPSAMFMYEDDAGQRITLDVAPSDGSETAFQFSESGEVRSFWWLDGPLSYAIVGDVPRELLRQIALDAYDQLI